MVSEILGKTLERAMCFMGFDEWPGLLDGFGRAARTILLCVVFKKEKSWEKILNRNWNN